MKQMSMWKWVGLGAGVFIIMIIMVASHSSPAKVSASVYPSTPAPDAPAEEDSSTKREVNSLLQQINKANQEEAQQQAGVVPLGVQAINPEQMQALQQQRQIQAEQEYLRNLQASMQPRDEGLRDTESQSFVMSFRDNSETYESPKDSSSSVHVATVDPPSTVSVDPQKSKADFSIPIGETNDQGAVARYPIYQGTEIPALLEDDVDSGIPGPVKCVTTATLTSADGQKVLILKGSKAIGHTESVDGAGQHRLQIVFDYLLTPGNFEIHLSDLPSQGEDGQNGIKGHVNNHYLRTFGMAMAIGLIGSGSTIGAAGPLTAGGIDQLRYGFSNGMSEGAMQVLSRNAFIQPTITLKGNKTRLQIVVIGRDLALPAVEDQKVKKSL